MMNDIDLDKIHNVLGKLQTVSYRLRMFGMYVSIFTAGSFVSSLLSFPSIYYFPPYIMLPLFFSFFAASFLLLIYYDRLRRRGDAIFEELSDELQWNLTRSFKSEAPRDTSRPDLEARVLLREYINTIDLPLTRGKQGITIYTAINLLSLILFVFSLFFQRRFY